MKCLVLGGGGFQGSHLSDALLDAGHAVRIFERKGIIKNNVAHILEKVEWIEGDFADSGHLEEVVKGVDVIFHLVSTTLPKTSNDNVVYDISTNLIPTLHLLEAARKNNIKKVIFFSSGGTVYGIPRNTPISEDYPTNPICSYGIHKLAIEKYLHFYYHNYGIDYAILRISNPYGERQDFHGHQGAVSVFSYKALKKEPVEIWGDGLIVRDYIHVSDVISAAVALLWYKGDYKVFNIGSGIGMSLLEVVHAIEKVVEYSVKLKFMPARDVDTPVNILDVVRAKRFLSWSPKVNFSEGIDWTVRYIASSM